jgi:L-ascorbate metabolism protein UlaG (beta-lactamase superfamily)
MGTLWCSWVIRGPEHRVYFSGDSGYHHGFCEIGAAFGPFDLALMECGAYSEYWPDIHMQPEQSVQAALDVKAAIAMPIHWGKFNLSLHPWKEPVERFLAASQTNGLKVMTPLPGEIIRVNGKVTTSNWWKKYD